MSLETEGFFQEDIKKNKKKKKKGEGKNEASEVIFEARVDCTSCRDKVQKSLIHYPGVEEILFDENKVIVRGHVIDAKKLFEVSKTQSGNRITKLLHPEMNEKSKEEKKEAKKEPSDVTVILKVQMHCGECIKQAIKAARNIHGVYDVVVEDNKITLKGKGLDAKLVCEDLKKNLGKYVEIVAPEKNDEKSKKNEEKIHANQFDMNLEKCEEFIGSQYDPYNYPIQYFAENPDACFIM